MNISLPDATCIYPVVLPDGTRHPGTVHLKNVIDIPNVDVGDYTYASDFDPPPAEGWLNRLAPYLFSFSQDRLVIGRFCQIAHGVRFIGASASHAMDGVSTYPFSIFDPTTLMGFQPDTRDTFVGHDVWLGFGAMILPGAVIGNGVIVGAGSVVRGTIPDYSVVTGNPARVVRKRFSDDVIARLTDLCWWDWPADVIASARTALETGDIDTLERLAP